MSSLNIGNAILIVGCLYFGYTYGWNLGLYLLILLGIITWAYHAFAKEKEDLLNAQIEFFRAKAEYYRKRSVER